MSSNSDMRGKFRAKSMTRLFVLGGLLGLLVGCAATQGMVTKLKSVMPGSAAKTKSAAAPASAAVPASAAASGNTAAPASAAVPGNATAPGGGTKLKSAAVPGGAPQGSVDARKLTFPPLKFQLPKSERVELNNGMVVYLLPDRELPIVNLTVYLNAGGIYETPEQTGLAALTGAVLRSGGTAKTTPEQMDRELEFMASSIESVVNADHANVSLSSLTKNLDRTLELFSEVIATPAFDPARVELARMHAIESIRRQNDDPKGIASRELNRAIYAGHPLGRIPTLASVQAITRDDMVLFHKRYFYPANAILAVSGDFDQGQMVAKLEKAFAGWPNRSTAFPKVPDPKDEPKAELHFVQKEVNQSVIRMGHLGIDKNNPDLYAIKVMDYILGGGFTSRLTQEIRSNQGLAYNVESYFETGRRFRGPFIAETETKSETTAKAIGLLRSIIAGMTEAEVSEEELRLAKDAIVNSFIFGFARSDVVVNQQARLEFYRYPEGYLEKYRDNIAAVTRQDVLRVAKKYLHLDAMKLVVVGNGKKFDKPLSGFGTVHEIKLNEIK